MPALSDQDWLLRADLESMLQALIEAEEPNPTDQYSRGVLDGLQAARQAVWSMPGTTRFIEERSIRYGTHLIPVPADNVTIGRFAGGTERINRAP